MLSVGNANIFPAHFGGLSAVLAAGMPVVTGAGGQLTVGMPGSAAAAAAAAAVAAGLMPGNEMNSPSPDMFTTVRYILSFIPPWWSLFDHDRHFFFVL